MKINTFGIDEAGRGPLAGPVAVAVFGVRAGFKLKARSNMSKGTFDMFPKGRDSKKMSESEREKWFAVFKEEKKKGNVFYEVALPSANMIDVKGIVGSIRKGMDDCLKKMEHAGIAGGNSRMLLDGSLRAPERFLHQKTIIKGDEKEVLIACASIVAKVTRDHHMKKLAKKYPAYKLEIHKGYGTLFHRSVIKKWGLSPIHRKTFCKSYSVV